ncbi:hypothetical protein [Polycladomyces subterraneus]|nr:hypothetical protein [Polycladomyces subterraneus]
MKLVRISREQLLNCKLGYFLDREHTGRWLDTETVRLAVRSSKSGVFN